VNVSLKDSAAEVQKAWTEYVDAFDLHLARAALHMFRVREGQEADPPRARLQFVHKYFPPEIVD
jgi:hypothetical protein